MRRLVVIVLLLLVVPGRALAQAPVKSEAPDRPPDQTFRAVHLVKLNVEQEKAMLGCLTAFNDGMAKAGFPAVRYRLWKVAGQQQGAHSHLWEATWPSGTAYQKIHSHPAYVAAVDDPRCARARAFRQEMQEIYNRYVEVVPAGRK